jgi:acyl-coenzyme A synthetase/AMP-(fatty) acid ligase
MLTRNFINPNIVYHEYFKDSNDTLQFYKSYNFNELCDLIDTYKQSLKSYNLKKGDRVVCGLDPNISQIASIFACWELGLVIAIIDYSRIDKWEDNDYIDPKTKLLLPIDAYITYSSTTWGDRKQTLFSKLCRNLVNVNAISNNKESDVSAFECDSKDNAIICTSSGTTGTPKVITHNHKFLFELAIRNSGNYYGRVGMTHNLNHGSSLATFFLPSLCSKNVTDFYYVHGNVANYVEDLKIDHLIIPYSHLIDNFFKKNEHKNLSQLNIYTLSTLKSEWLTYYKKEKIKDIISIFGSNETSGPVFLNNISDSKFVSNKFFKVDDFYEINLGEDGELLVTLPFYNKTINTNDTFTYVNGYYYHKGRNDLLRINGKEVMKDLYTEMVTKTLNGELVLDTVYQKIYLAVFESYTNLDHKIQEINKFLESKSGNSHFLSKFKILNKEDFLTGIKLDQELLRDYFRNHD